MRRGGSQDNGVGPPQLCLPAWLQLLVMLGNVTQRNVASLLITRNAVVTLLHITIHNINCNHFESRCIVTFDFVFVFVGSGSGLTWQASQLLVWAVQRNVGQAKR